MEPDTPAVVHDPQAPPHRHGGLGASMRVLREVLATAGSGRGWADRVTAALAALAADFRRQAPATGSPEGGHRSVLSAQPRLANAVAGRVRDEGVLVRDIDALLTYTVGAGATVSVDEVRGRGGVLLARLARYRQDGGDLLHEVDQVDLGGEGG